MKEGAFREDLYYRLNVMTIHIPPLRDRLDTIPLLVDTFLRKYNEEYKKNQAQVSDKVLDAMMSYRWAGNVRELENMVKRMVVLGSEELVLQELAVSEAPAEEKSEGDALDFAALGGDFSSAQTLDLKAISKRAAQTAEKRVIERVLHQTRWNRKEAAERLQISYKALLYKMKENGLSDAR